jgi:hypothetical protein
LLFSTGRIEKGDEVWRLRVDHPIFQKFDERILVYSFFCAVWIGISIFVAGYEPGFIDDHWRTLPPMLAALLMSMALARFFTHLSDGRNKVTLGLVVSLLFFWAVVPALGYFIGEIGSRPGKAPSKTAATVSEYLMESSPVVMLFRIEDDRVEGWLFCTIAVLVISLLAVLPTFMPKLKSRTAVSYDWTASRAEAAPAESAA